VVLVLLTVLVGSGACANSEQWATWREHSSHFASGDHLAFSFRNEGKHPVPRVTTKDLDNSQAQNWWGDPVVVRPEEVVGH
jgi:hypothetical protein